MRLLSKRKERGERELMDAWDMQVLLERAANPLPNVSERHVIANNAELRKARVELRKRLINAGKPVRRRYS